MSANTKTNQSDSAQIKSESISIQIPVGAWVDITDNYGYYCMNGCGIVEKSFPDGHVIIRNGNGQYFASAAFIGKTITVIAKAKGGRNA